MKTLVACYSFTGNNSKLAEGIAKKFDADYWEVKEVRKRTIFTILFDLVLNRYPAILKPNYKLPEYEQILLIAPVWFGKIASPIRTIFRQYKDQIKSYTVISLSAGFEGTQTDIEKELVKLSGIRPKTVLNLLINDLLPDNPKPSRKTLDRYRLKQEDVVALVSNVSLEIA
jgi:flavodoxin